MSAGSPDLRTCMHCGETFSWAKSDCPHCGMHQAIPPKLRVWGLGFMQNRLRTLVSQGELAEPIADRLIALLREEQLTALGKRARASVDAAGVPPSPTPHAAAVAQPVEIPPDAIVPLPPSGGPSSPSAFDVALAGPNVLLYLGAFLIVVSGLILVTIAPEDLSAQLRLLLGIGGTVGFFAAGARLHRIERVRAAASTLLVLGALLVPLDVWSIATALFDAEHSARRHLLLAGSVLSAGLYASLAVRGYGTHFAYFSAAAVVGVAEGSVQSLELGSSWRAVPHLAVATAMLVAAGSATTTLRRLVTPLARIVPLVELYAAIVIAIVGIRTVTLLAVDVANVASAGAFAVVARMRGDPARSTAWSWIAWGAASLAVFGLIPRAAPEGVRVGGLLLIALASWSLPLSVPMLRWAREPGRITGWVAAAAALLIGFTSEPLVRSIALAGVTFPLAYAAWTSERARSQAARPNLIGALIGAYLFWITDLQIAGLLPVFDPAAAQPFGQATAVAFLAVWPWVVWLTPRADPWSRELRVAAHVLAALAILLAVPASGRSVFDAIAVGPALGMMLAAFAIAYGVAIREPRLPESGGLFIPLGAAAAVGLIEAVLGGLTAWAILTPGLIGAFALASVAFVPWPSGSAARAGGVAAVMVGLAVFGVYAGVHRSGVEIAATLVALLAGVLIAYAMPQVQQGYRWTFPATAALVAFALARTSDDGRAYDPQLAALPFVLVFVAPALVRAARRRTIAEEDRTLVLAGVITLGMSAASSLGRYGPVWSPAVVAVEVAVVAAAGLRMRDQAIAGVAVALAAMAGETALRQSRATDLLVQGAVYGAIALGGAWYLARPALLVDRGTVRGLYALAIALLTVPAMVRATQRDGWWAVTYLAAIAAGLLTAGLRLRHPLLGTAGSVLAVVAVVAGYQQARVVETLVYTTTVGAYLVGLGLFAARMRLLPDVVTRDLVALVRWSGALLLLIPAVIRSWQGPEYGVIFFVLLAVVLGAGIALRQRTMLAAAAGAVGLEAVWVVTTVARLLPFWMLFGIAGSVLLAVGTLLVFRRDLLERVQSRIQAQWDLAE